MVFKALEDIPRGAPVYDSYGNTHTNLKFFLAYGFVNTDCKIKNAILGKFKLDENDPLFEIKKTILAPGLNWNGFVIQNDLTQKSMQNLI